MAWNILFEYFTGGSKIEENRKQTINNIENQQRN